jgi:hypothetical protein
VWVPVESTDGATYAQTLVEVPLAELRARMTDFDPARAAVYAGGRAPVPHALVDRDADGVPDVLLVAMPVAEGSALAVVCPGPSGGGILRETGAAGPVRLRWDLAKR